MPPTVGNIRREICDVDITMGAVFGNVYSQVYSRSKAIRKFEEQLRDRLVGPHKEFWLEALHRLKGKKLGCVCSPKPCHGDVLVKLYEEYFGNDQIPTPEGGKVGE